MCISSNWVNEAQDLMYVTKFCNLPNKQDPNDDNYQVDKTVDKERESFIKHKEMFKTDQDPVRHRPHQRRQYVVSQVGGQTV